MKSIVYFVIIASFFAACTKKNGEKAIVTGKKYPKCNAYIIQLANIEYGVYNLPNSDTATGSILYIDYKSLPNSIARCIEVGNTYSTYEIIEIEKIYK